MNTVFAYNVKAFRSRIALSQDELGAYLGITREDVNYYENGKRNIPQNLLPQLAHFFGVDECDLFEEGDNAINKTTIAFAFDANTIYPEDLNTIASLKKIVLNYLKIQKFANANEQ